MIQKRDAEGVVAALEQINMNSGEVEGWKERGRKMIEDRYSLNEMNRETEVTYVMSAYEREYPTNHFIQKKKRIIFPEIPLVYHHHD